MKRVLFFGICFLLFGSPNPAPAVEKTMEEVVVTASRLEEGKKDVTASVTVINEEEIKMSSASDLGDLLAEKGAVHIKKYPGALTSIGIRGFKTETHGNDLQGHVVILLDGRRIATGNAAKVMTKNIERVEIIRGPAAVQYGSAAVGGLVNVITKKGQEKPSFFAEGKAGSFGYREGSAGFSGKMEKFDLSASVTRSEMDDYETGDGVKYKNTGYDRKLGYSVNGGFEFLPENRIGVTFTGFDADKIGDSGYITANDLDDYKDSKNSSIDVDYQGKLSSGFLAWQTRYFQCNDEDIWVDPTESNPGSNPGKQGYDDAVASKMETDSKGVQGQVSLNMESFTLTTGIDWVNYDIEATWTPEKTEFDNGAAFLLAKKKFFDDKLIFTGGLRYDTYDVEVKEPAGRDEDDTNLSPSAGVACHLGDHLKIRASYAEAFVMPAAKELAADFVSGETRYVGNPDLDPETSKTYEAGMDITYSSFHSSLTLFTTEFEDKIESGQTSGGDSTWVNLGEATISGVEGDIRGYVRDVLPFDLEINPYALFTYLFEYEDEESDSDLQYTPEVDLSCGIAVTNLDDFTADLSVIYTGSQDVTDFQFGTRDQFGNREVVKLDSSTVANFTVSKRILQLDKYGALSLRGEVKNIFDKDYAYVQGYPMPGRAYYLGVKYDF